MLVTKQINGAELASHYQEIKDRLHQRVIDVVDLNALNTMSQSAVEVQLAKLIEQYAAGSPIVRQAVAGMTREQVLARPIAGKWSSLEVVCHLADFEIVYVDRLASVIAEDGPMLPGRDEQKFAARLAYHERDLEERMPGR